MGGKGDIKLSRDAFRWSIIEKDLREHWRDNPIHRTRTSCDFQRTCSRPNNGVLIVVDH